MLSLLYGYSLKSQFYIIIIFMHENSVPNLAMTPISPIFCLEKTLGLNVKAIETWFHQQWQLTPPPITSSVDLRHAGYKLAPVDTNLFPAGFNNLNPDFLPQCVHAVQAIVAAKMPQCKKILLLPETHTRNTFYGENLKVLCSIFENAGFELRLGNIDSNESITVPTQHESILLEPLVRDDNRISLHDFIPCLVILNNDLSRGIPPILENLQQPIWPSVHLGWSSRLKSNHFKLYSEVVSEFAKLLQFDPWFIEPYFYPVENIDFMAQTGLDVLAEKAEFLLNETQKKYTEYAINDTPYLAVKADNGTYGMSVMMVKTSDSLQKLNRKQRTKMAASKGSQKVEKVLLQEGVYSCESMEDGSVAEPVVYMMGEYVVGGFYRVHHGRSNDENLNAPGMYFEPLKYAACNAPNRFYIYSVIARLAALAAAREIAISGAVG